MIEIMEITSLLDPRQEKITELLSSFENQGLKLKFFSRKK